MKLLLLFFKSSGTTFDLQMAYSTLSFLSELLKDDMPILSPALDTNIQDDMMLRKVLRAMILLVVLHRLPRDIDQIPVLPLEPLILLDGLQHAPSHDAPATVDVPHDVRPQRPRALVPRRVGAQVDGRADGVAEEGWPKRVVQGLVAQRGVPDPRIAGVLVVVAATPTELFDDGEELVFVLWRRLERCAMLDIVPYCPREMRQLDLGGMEYG